MHLLPQVQAEFGSRRGSAIRHLGMVLIALTMLTAHSHASPDGSQAEDIMGGCDQFIKFSHKGWSREDPDTMRHMGECLGAVRAVTAYGIKDDEICPAAEVKNVDAVTTFSLYVKSHPEELRTVYVVAMRKAFMEAWPCPTSGR